jgi:hypothetical protein
MPIPELQLDTWSHQGSITQSRTTYNSIKTLLVNTNTPYSKKNYKVFLQGSYGNDTNIYSESDVDIVIQLNDCFQHDLSLLPKEQKEVFTKSNSGATYAHVNFKGDVLIILSKQYGSSVTEGEKAIAIAAYGNRRKADVIPAIQFRRYHKFISTLNQSYEEGICFYTTSGEKIVNYPKQHSENLTRKHQANSQWLKPMIRILKNLRSRLIVEGMLESGVAPSYYLEGLLYNVPNDKFGNNYQDTFVKSMNWILEADRSKFVCANEQYYLLRDNSPVTWRSEKCEAFITAAIDLWNRW